MGYREPVEYSEILEEKPMCRRRRMKPKNRLRESLTKRLPLAPNMCFLSNSFRDFLWRRHVAFPSKISEWQHCENYYIIQNGDGFISAEDLREVTQ
jgi:hypothetical protein